MGHNFYLYRGTQTRLLLVLLWFCLDFIKYHPNRRQAVNFIEGFLTLFNIIIASFQIGFMLAVLAPRLFWPPPPIGPPVNRNLFWLRGKSHGQFRAYLLAQEPNHLRSSSVFTNQTLWEQRRKTSGFFKCRFEGKRGGTLESVVLVHELCDWNLWGWKLLYSFLFWSSFWSTSWLHMWVRHVHGSTLQTVYLFDSDDYNQEGESLRILWHTNTTKF